MYKTCENNHPPPLQQFHTTLVITLMSPPKERERGCFLLGAGGACWRSLVGGDRLVCLTNCSRREKRQKETLKTQSTFVAAQRAAQQEVQVQFQDTNLPDEFLLLGRVGHVLVDVPEELLQGLLCVLLCGRRALLLCVRTQGRRPLQGRHSAPGRGAACRQHIQIVLGGGRAKPGRLRLTRECDGSYFASTKYHILS